MTQAGRVYGEALYDLAKAENLSASILKEITVLGDAFTREPDFLRLLAAPSLSKEERCQILDASFKGKVHVYVLNFLKILTEKGYVRHFGDCCKAYRDLYNRDNGILPVRAVSAVALSKEQTAKLTAKLSSVTGKTVLLENRVDPDVLGGIRLDYDGKCLDDTVSHRLDAVRNLLKNTVL
jgi:F-type H+-transporting ATPase subunit delta